MVVDFIIGVVIVAIISAAVWFIALNVRLRDWGFKRQKPTGELEHEENLTEDNEELETSASDEEDSNADDTDDDGQAKLAVKIKNICQIAHMHIEYIVNPDEWGKEEVAYESERFEQYKNKAKDVLQNISDEYYRGFALHQIIDICVEANQMDEAKELFSEIEDEFIREQVIENHPTLE